MLLRLFHGILGGRICRILLNACQKGFLPIDGCAENVWMVQHIVERSKLECRPTYLVFMDVVKGFNSVSHQTLIKACKCKVVLGPMLRYLAQLYADLWVKLKGTSRHIKQCRGIQQGDNLSGDLFNWVIEIAQGALSGVDCGVTIG
jgi:hypothetical protein